MNELPHFGEGGWFWLTPEGRQAQAGIAAADAERHLDLARAYARVFGTADGLVVLADLCARTVEQPTWVPGAPDPVHAGFAREGQNSMTRYIEGQIAAAHRNEGERHD